jgi:hypothetical protein
MKKSSGFEWIGDSRKGEEMCKMTEEVDNEERKR